MSAVRLRRLQLRTAIPLLAGALLALGAARARPAANAPPQPQAEARPFLAPTLEALMHGMATTAGVVAEFREVKELGLLSVPLEVRGTLYFVPPDRLARITTEPSRSRLVIDGGRFAYRDEAGGEQVDLSGNPVARTFVDNFIVLFNGDLDALRARYDPTFRAEGRHWSLVLRPRHQPLAGIVDRVTLEGEGRALTRMDMLETSGDRTTTTFDHVQVDRHFGPEELRRIFAMPGPDPEAP